MFSVASLAIPDRQGKKRIEANLLGDANTSCRKTLKPIMYDCTLHSRTAVCVFVTLHRSFYRSTSNTPSLRADSLIPKSHKLCSHKTTTRWNCLEYTTWQFAIWNVVNTEKTSTTTLLCTWSSALGEQIQRFNVRNSRGHWRVHLPSSATSDPCDVAST